MRKPIEKYACPFCDDIHDDYDSAEACCEPNEACRTLWKGILGHAYTIERLKTYPYHRQEKPGIQAVLEWCGFDADEDDVFEVPEYCRTYSDLDGVLEKAKIWAAEEEPLPEPEK